MIESKLKKIINDALESALKGLGHNIDNLPEIIIEKPKLEKHGDYASNIAMNVARQFKLNPRELAVIIVETIKNKQDKLIEKMEIAGPGFINFTLCRSRYLEILKAISKEKTNFGKINIGKNKKVQVEFVSANPTGPLHVGHGRGAIYGDALASILAFAGFNVSREYYLNDAGNQINTLGKSVRLRLKELDGEIVEFPEDCYQGHYIVDIAREIKASKQYLSLLKKGELHLQDYCSMFASKKILNSINEDLNECGIKFDNYFSEKSLHEDGTLEKIIKILTKNGVVYENDGAMWFKTKDFGDEKDRVLKKSSGGYTYFASDIAYHFNKFNRGFDRLVDVWGADHGGHVPKMKYAVKALGYNPDALDLVLIQLVNLIQKGELVSMSTRSAKYETLKDLIKEVGKDVCRYFFLMRSHNAQLDFDIELAKKQSPENPVYYIQYAHARIASIFRKAENDGIKYVEKNVDLKHIDLDEEFKLARFLSEFPKVISNAATNLEPHKVSFYLLELARIFQSYYSMAKTDERYKVLDGSNERICSKLYLLKNIKIVLQNGLNLIGITAPDEMIREE